MNLKNIISYSLFMFFCILLTSNVAKQELTGFKVLERQENNEVLASGSEACNDFFVKRRLYTTDPQLRMVEEYESVCRSSFFNQMMIFTNMPISNINAEEMADDMTVRLNAFKDYGIRPMVVVEPDSDWGLVDFNEFSGGFYDEWIDTYFRRLKINGIENEGIGMWIPFPEPQQDFWNNNKNPDDFAISVNRYFKILKKYYPESEAAILLDSEAGSGNISQLIAYTRLIDTSLVDVAGLQGFPWYPPEEEDSRPPLLSASHFAPAYMLQEVADSINTKKVLINTGTFRQKNLLNGGITTVSTLERRLMLGSIVYEAKLLREAGYDVTLNLFSENKLNTPEGVNWSYWQIGNPSSAHLVHGNLFIEFIRNLNDLGVKLSIFAAPDR